MLVAAALGASRPTSAAPPADYEARVKRLEQARASAADPASVDEKLLRLHLSALSRARRLTTIRSTPSPRRRSSSSSSAASRIAGTTRRRSSAPRRPS